MAHNSISHNLTRWLFSTNAKDIGTLYLIYAIFTGLMGTAFSILIRLELSAPGSQFLAGDHQLFNVAVTSHGIIMIYFMIVPAMAGFGNYMVPVLIGAPDNKKHYSTNTSGSSFPSYLAGLWEGDGHVWVPKTTHAPSGKLYSPHFCITFASKEKMLGEAIQSKVGGYLRHKEKENAYVLTITKISDLLNVVNLINGQIRTPKITQFESLINWLNTNKKESIVILPLNNSSLLNNAWAAGFIDADGSFLVIVHNLNVVDGKTVSKNRVEAKFRLEQRKEYNGLKYCYILRQLSESFDTYLRTATHNGVEYWSLELTSPAKCSTLISYLDTYPLFSSKYLNYKD
jgi:hypothetical protein